MRVKYRRASTGMSRFPPWRGEYRPCTEAERNPVAGAQSASTHGLRLPGGFRAPRPSPSPLRAAILASEWVLLMAFLGREGDERVGKAARYILRQQQPDGGWSNYPGGPAELSVSVKAYFALKLAGHDPDAPHMSRARTVIRSL